MTSTTHPPLTDNNARDCVVHFSVSEKLGGLHTADALPED